MYLFGDILLFRNHSTGLNIMVCTLREHFAREIPKSILPYMSIFRVYSGRFRATAIGNLIFPIHCFLFTERLRNAYSETGRDLFYFA